MIIPDLVKLYEPFMADGSTLEMFLQFEHKKARELGIDPLVIDAVITSAFLDIAHDSTSFSQSKCRCGCGIDKSSTDLAHEVLRRAIEMDKQQKVEYAEGLRKSIERIVKDHVERENAKFIAEHAPPEPEELKEDAIETKQSWLSWFWDGPHEYQQ